MLIDDDDMNSHPTNRPTKRTAVALIAILAILTIGAACGSSPESTATSNTDTIATSALNTAASEADEDNETDYQPATFAVEGDTATMSGVIGPSTPDAVRALIDDNPTLSTIVMVDVPGSLDDVSNIEASRLVRDAGLATHVPAKGRIASGGVDFFLAGTTRTYESGAEFGVHSWATGDDASGADLSRDDPQHRIYLDYYAEVGIAADFYWFTLEAAPAESIHNMTEPELDEYGFATVA